MESGDKNLHFSCLISVCQRTSTWCSPGSSPLMMQLPGNLLLSRWLYTLSLNTLIFSLFLRRLSYFLFFRTLLTWAFVLPLCSPSSPLLLVVVAGSVLETSSFKMYDIGIFYKSKMHQQKDVNGRVPAKMAGGILEEGSQNRLPAGPLNPFALG